MNNVFTIILGLVLGVLISISINICNNQKVLKDGLNNITIAIQEQNRILGYNPEEATKNENV